MAPDNTPDNTLPRPELQQFHSKFRVVRQRSKLRVLERKVFAMDPDPYLNSYNAHLGFALILAP